MTDATSPRTLDARALKALAHPLRVRIFDILSQYGPQTASSLAERLGESSGATSYHLRALAKHDLIREVEGRGTARERWWERPRGAVSISSGESLRTPSGRAASQIVVTETYRQRHEQLMRFIDESLRDEGEIHPAAELSTATTRLTRAQFTEIAADINRIITAAVENHREFIFNYRDCPSRISNGYTECANRLINETNMMGRGHSFETLRARTLYRSLSRHRGMALRLSSRLSEQEWVRLPQVSLRRCLSHPPVRGP